MAKRNFNGEGSFRKISKEDEPEKWTGRKQFGNKPNGNPNIKAVYGKSESEVRKKMREYEKTYNSNQKISASQGSKECFEDYLLRWFETYKKPKLKTRTYEMLQSSITGRFKPYDISKYQLQQLTTDIIQRYINQLATEKRKDKNGKATLPPYSLESIKKIYNLMNNCLTYATQQDHIVKNPMIGTVLPSEESMTTKTKEIEFFAEEDIKILYKEFMRKFKNGKYVYSNNGLALAFLMWTGLRVGEMLALTYNDISLENRTLKVSKSLSRLLSHKPDSAKYENVITTPKTKSSIRIIQLSKQAVFILEELKRINNPKSDEEFIFVTKNGENIIDRNLRRTLNSIQETVGTKIQNSGNHVLRHTYASYMLLNGIDVAVVSKLLGHSKVSTTYNTYIHIIESQKMTAVNIFDTP